MAKKILIAEDDKVLAKIMELKFKKIGYQVKVVSNGEDAIVELKKNNYNLLLLDMVMPRMNGFDVLKIIKEKKISTPVIVTSNLGQETDFAEAKALGVVDYFVKSNVPMKELVANVQKFLEK